MLECEAKKLPISRRSEAMEKWIPPSFWGGGPLLVPTSSSSSGSIKLSLEFLNRLGLHTRTPSAEMRSGLITRAILRLANVMAGYIPGHRVYADHMLIQIAN